jgi:hypothetical protein
MRSDVPFSTIKRVFVASLVIVAVIQVGIWAMYQYLRTQDQRRNVSRTFLDVAPPVPPEPRLQVNPQQEFQQYLRGQQETLKSYAWTSRAEGRVRIPIDRAMELVVEKERQ